MTAERWAEAAPHVFEAGTPGTLANFLGKSPEHPVLNYHMGKLLIGDAKRSDKAKPFPTMGADLLAYANS